MLRVALSDQEHLREVVQHCHNELDFLESQLLQFNTFEIEVLRGEANFLICKLPMDANLFSSTLMRDFGLLVAPLNGFGLSQWIRVSPGIRSQNKKIFRRFDENIGGLSVLTFMQVNEGLLIGGIEGLSDEVLKQQFMLYKSAVQHLNSTRAELDAMRRDGRSENVLYRDRGPGPAAEWNKVLLYELYFENLKKDDSISDGSLITALVRQWGSLEELKVEILRLSKSRYANWLVLGHDPYSDQLYLQQVDMRGLGLMVHQSLILCLNLADSSYCRGFWGSR